MASRGSAPSWLLGFTLLVRAPRVPQRPATVGQPRLKAANNGDLDARHR
jgi:hypothetical protein